MKKELYVNKLKRIRLENGFTQEEMGKKCGVSQRLYSMIETGNTQGSVWFWINLQNAFYLSQDDTIKIKREIKKLVDKRNKSLYNRGE